MGDEQTSAGDQKTSTFLVTHVEPASAVLKDVHDGQVHTVDGPTEFAVDDAVEATIAPEPPMELTYRVVELEARWALTIEHSEEPPTAREHAIATDQPTGELTREPRAGIGEIHVLSPPEDATDAAAADVLEDRESTLSRAARLGVNRVEIRTEPGVLSVRYLP